tara:strand:- start:2159 stop:2332 length:174 start_codon:yes stop_codon:yes gene_type:complete
MNKEIGMKVFLKNNILDCISKKYEYSPECLPFLKKTKKEIKEVDAFLEETILFFEQK